MWYEGEGEREKRGKGESKAIKDRVKVEIV